VGVRKVDQNHRVRGTQKIFLRGSVGRREPSQHKRPQGNEGINQETELLVRAASLIKGVSRNHTEKGINRGR